MRKELIDQNHWFVRIRRYMALTAWIMLIFTHFTLFFVEIARIKAMEKETLWFYICCVIVILLYVISVIVQDTKVFPHIVEITKKYIDKKIN